MIPKAPCLNCPNRYIGCHDVCEKYLVYRKEQDSYLKKRNHERSFERIMDIRDFRRRRHN